MEPHESESKENTTPRVENETGPSPDVSQEKNRHRYMIQLRERVEEVVAEIQTLRKENHSLKTQLKELKDKTEAPGSGLNLPAGEDAEAFKRKVEHFINTIDRFLEGDKAAGTG